MTGETAYRNLQIYRQVKDEVMRKPGGTPGTFPIDVVEFVLGMRYAEEQITKLAKVREAAQEIAVNTGLWQNEVQKKARSILEAIDG